MATPLSAIILDAKDLADLLNNTLVADATWRRWANQGTERLYRLLVAKAPARFHKSASFTLTGVGGNTVSLAADFRSLREGGVTRNPTVPGSRQTLRRFKFGERDAQGILPAWGSGRELAYDIQGSPAGTATLVVEPASLCAGSYAYYYLAGPVKWATTGDDDTVDIAPVFEPYVDFVAHWMARKGALKGEDYELARDLKEDLSELADEIQAEFSDGSDPAAIIDVEQVGGTIWR